MNLINKDTKFFISISSNPSNFGTLAYNSLFKKFKINAIYKSFKFQHIKDLKKIINFLNIRGISISMPFKEKIIYHVDYLDRISKKILAVNTIKNISGKLYGFNTDYLALKSILKKIKNKKKYNFLINGYGSISKTLIFVLKEFNIKNIYILGRNKKKIKDFAKKFNCFVYSNIFRKPVENLFLINCTPIGMKRTKYSAHIPFSKKMIENSDIIMDLVNYPPNTKLVKFGKKFGKKTISGSQISLYQIKHQFKIYSNKEISILNLKKILKKNSLLQ